MRAWKRLIVVGVLMGSTAPCVLARPNAAVNVVEDDAMLQHWLLLGPLPNPLIPEEARTGPVDGAGFDRDFLEGLGGEANAEIQPDTEIRYTDAGGTVWAASVQRVSADPEAGIALDPLYTPFERRLVYAFCFLDVEEAQTVGVLFGSDDRAMVWLNGERVHRFDAVGRAHVPGEDRFSMALKAGRNRLLVKVENGEREWGFSLRVLGADAYQAALDEEARKQRAARVQDAELRPDPPFLRAFPPGPFPEIVWKNPEVLAQHYGDLDMQVRWFDAELQEVEQATALGRYGAYIEATAPDGFVIRRAMTFYCRPGGFEPWRSPIEVKIPHIAGSGIGAEVWRQQEKAIARLGNNALVNYLFEEDGVAVLAGLHDVQKAIDAGASDDGMGLEPRLRDQAYHLRLKAKVLGLDRVPSLQTPRPVKGAGGAVLREGSAQEGGFTPGVSDALDRLCREWVEDTGIPFTFLLARHGVIVHHDAYGEVGGMPIDTETSFDVASISKMLTATLVAQFLDQDVIQLDQPIGRWLVGFPVDGEKAMTVRQCMAHCAGTEGHGNWGGFANPWFENSVAQGLELYEPGRRYTYNGLSLNLVGRVMEMAAGVPFPQLMHERLFDALGCGDSEVYDTSYGTLTTAHDLAHVAQLVLNGGSYGGVYFFAPETRDLLFPVRLGDVFPGVAGPDQEYGLGTSWMRDPPNPDSPEGAAPEERTILGFRTLGHGSATASVLRADFDNDLIITMARPTGGPRYDQHFIPILQTVAEHLVREEP